MIASGQTKQHEGICLSISRYQRPDCQSKTTWNQVPLLDINFDGFSLAKLYQQRLSPLHVVTKKIYNFPEKSEQLKFILLMKISWLIFSPVSRVEMKTLQRSEKARFLISQPHTLVFTCTKLHVCKASRIHKLEVPSYLWHSSYEETLLYKVAS